MIKQKSAGVAGQPFTIVFFGLGAVGSSMLICFDELAERDGISVRFLVYSIDAVAARDALFHAEQLLDRLELVEVPDFEAILAGYHELSGRRAYPLP
jgi:hypothetical protein